MRTPRRRTLCSGDCDIPGDHMIITSADVRLTRCPTAIATWELSYKYNFIPLSWRKEVLGKIDTPQARMINRLEQVTISFILSLSLFLVKVWFDGDWPWGENWILCDQLAMVACLHPESVMRSSSVPAR